MKLRDLLKRGELLAELDPSLLDEEVLQQSCFDEPLAFESTNMYVADHYYNVEGTLLLDSDEADSRADEDGNEVEICGRAIVIESF